MPHILKSLCLGLSRSLGACLARLSPSEIENLAFHYANTAGSRQSQAIRSFAKEIVTPTRGAIYNAELNGEAEIIRRTGPLGFTTVFDVGANRGDWAAAVRDAHPAATVHCFEILPSTFATLERRFGGADHMVLNPCGLSEREEQVPVYVADDAYVSSMHEFLGDAPRNSVLCDVVRGDDYADRRGLKQIDFLKVDVEGAEGSVLRGFDRYLSSGRISLIQFEYNRGAIQSRFLLIDFYEMLSKYGYQLGRLTGRGVEFGEYHYALEDFQGPNYVACLRREQRIVAAIAAA